MRVHRFHLPLSVAPYAIVASLVLAAAPFAGEASATLLAADGEGRSPAYRDAQSALDAARWAEASELFGAIAEKKNSDSDAALYWKAYAEEKLGRRTEALQSLKRLRAGFPKSAWIDDADALEMTLRPGGPISEGPVTAGPALSGPAGSGPVVAGGGASVDEDLQLYALDGLMAMESSRALPILQKLLAGNRSLKVKQRALFVLSQSDDPEARAILVATAKSGKPEELQIEAVRSLGIAGDPEDIRSLQEIYRAVPGAETRGAILEAYLIAGEEKPLLDAARSDADPRMRSKAIELLGALDATSALVDLYRAERSTEVKGKILEGMMIAGDKAQLLDAARNETDRALRGKAIELLGAAQGDRELVELYAATADRDLREKIVQGLMIAGNGKAMVDLLRKEKDPELKKTILQHLSMMDDDAAMDEIERVLTEKP